MRCVVRLVYSLHANLILHGEGMSLVRISRVTKRYDERLVLRDVSFRLRKGERVGLLGRNGAGKTTLLRLILGLEDPEDGSVDVTQGVRLGYFSQFSDRTIASSWTRS